jgi:hypothetical protein
VAQHWMLPSNKNTATRCIAAISGTFQRASRFRELSFSSALSTRGPAQTRKIHGLLMASLVSVSRLPSRLPNLKSPGICTILDPRGCKILPSMTNHIQWIGYRNGLLTGEVSCLGWRVVETISNYPLSSGPGRIEPRSSAYSPKLPWPAVDWL